MTSGTVVLTLLAALLQAEPAFEPTDLAGYRLTQPVFERFRAAANLIADATGDDPRYAETPLVTREIALSDDVVAAATELHRRLTDDPALAAALKTANLPAREFTLFAISVIGARLAHGFVEAGVLKRVPPGVTADNVAFVGAHRAEVLDALARLQIRD